MRTIAGVGSVASRSAVDLADQPRLQADELGGANEVEFVGFALAKREFARELRRVGADAVIGGDPAQGAQAWVERRRLVRGGAVSIIEAQAFPATVSPRASNDRWARSSCTTRRRHSYQ